jgi:hypothetical protein
VFRAWVSVGTIASLAIALGCSGKSTRDAEDADPSAHDGSAAGTGAKTAGASGSGDDGTSGTGGTSNESGTSANAGSAGNLLDYCERVACPSSPQTVKRFCKVCPASAEPNTPVCTENIFGSTMSYESSCGGQSVVVHMGFDRTAWHFDANGSLVGVTWGSDTSSASYGEQCVLGDVPSQDHCSP